MAERILQDIAEQNKRLTIAQINKNTEEKVEAYYSLGRAYYFLEDLEVFSSCCLDNKVYTFYKCEHFIKKWNPEKIELTSGHPNTSIKLNNKVTNDRNISFYYINTNEIQGELSRENMIFTCENNKLSLHVKRSPLLWLHNKSSLSQGKNV